MLTKLYTKAYAAGYSFLKNRDGVTAIEYAIIGVAIATALSLVFTKTTSAGTFGGAIKGAMTTIMGKL